MVGFFVALFAFPMMIFLIENTYKMYVRGEHNLVWVLIFAVSAVIGGFAQMIGGLL